MEKSPTYGELQILDINSLVGWGCFEQYGYKGNQLTWRMRGEITGQIDYAVQYGPDEVYLLVSYRYQQQPRKYRIVIEPKASNLGKGVIWYFRCPVTQQRCRKLHMHQGWLTHRKAITGMYETQTHSKRRRQEKRVFDAVLDRADVVAELYKPHAKQTYRGKPTRRFTRMESKLIRMGAIAVNDFHLILRR